ncbi:hypothetical protein LJC02_01800 [Breznakia sp. OttesenSCG-928-G09]|nr:hypothetical protein [Breznakia sp. OttesenSCG-928-G09]
MDKNKKYEQWEKVVEAFNFVCDECNYYSKDEDKLTLFEKSIDTIDEFIASNCPIEIKIGGIYRAKETQYARCCSELITITKDEICKLVEGNRKHHIYLEVNGLAVCIIDSQFHHDFFELVEEKE